MVLLRRLVSPEVGGTDQVPRSLSVDHQWPAAISLKVVRSYVVAIVGAYVVHSFVLSTRADVAFRISERVDTMVVLVVWAEGGAKRTQYRRVFLMGGLLVADLERTKWDHVFSCQVVVRALLVFIGACQIELSARVAL